MLRFILPLCVSLSFLSAEVTTELAETSHKITIDGQEISYKATAGKLPYKNKEGKIVAEMFYVSYVKEDVENSSKRPVTFCFNGGPGSSSVWLHMGALGPKRVMTTLQSRTSPPYRMIDNELSILDLTDLVFIDPVGTGFSTAIAGEDSKQFQGIDEDVLTFAQFIPSWTDKNNRWNSPRYLAGESYGTLRAASLALKLHDDNYYYLNGVIMISTLLNYQTILDPVEGNDLPYILSLPTYTATAWHYKKLPPELLESREKALEASKNFAYTEYASALVKGDLLSEEEKAQIAKKLFDLTGITEAFWLRSNLRVSTGRFAKEFLRVDFRTVGRFDTRFQGIDSDQNGCFFESDPSIEKVAGVFTSLLNQYLQDSLNYHTDLPYQVLVNMPNWNYGKSNRFVNVSSDFKEVISKNNNLKVFVACGEYDLALPFLSSEYTFTHLNLDKSLRKNITLKRYPGGHMMYLETPILEQLRKDLVEFYRRSQPKKRVIEKAAVETENQLQEAE